MIRPSGVTWLWGRGVLNLVREFDSDNDGKLVGSDQAIIQPPQDDPTFSACNAPQGFTGQGATFSGECSRAPPPISDRCCPGGAVSDIG